MIIVLLPAYNEEKSLHSLLAKIKSQLETFDTEYKIVVCDDGSTDRTLEILNQHQQTMPIEIISHNINRGLGETARNLFEYASAHSHSDDTIIRMDCDDTHDPKYIPSLINKLNEGYDVVITSRFENTGGQEGVTKYRAIISRGANLFMKLFFPIPGLKEYTCGYRAYRASIIQSAITFYGNNFIQLKGLGFTCTLEKLVKLKMIGAKFAEVPFVLRYDQKQSDSKMIGSITMFGYFTMALLYHWPWGGWRRGYKKLYKQLNK